MADTVDSVVIESSRRRYIVRLTNVSDGTGESAVVKADKSTLVDYTNLEPYRFCVDVIKWSIQGFSSVRLFFDHTTDDELAMLATGAGERSYWGDGGLKDPLSAGGTGDIILTTAGAISGATYDIELNLRLESQF